MAFGAGYKFLEKEKKPDRKATIEGKPNPLKEHQHHHHNHLYSPPAALETVFHSQPLHPTSSSTSDLTSTNGFNAPHPGGWSYLLDDWLVHGNKNPKRKHTSASIPPQSPTSEASASHLSPSVLSTSPASINALADITPLSQSLEPPSALSAAAREAVAMTRSITEPVGEFTVLSRPRTKRSGTHVGDKSNLGPVPPSATSLVGGANVGPYELAVKERMMGIYLAVYVHRDVKPLLKGM